MHSWFAAVVMLHLLPVLQAPVAGVVYHGARDDRRVALTFDACSTHAPSQYDERITRALTDAGVPATIFVGGHWAREEAAHVRALAANPLFEIGNHTETHPHLTRLTDTEIRDELGRTQTELFALTGKRPTLFRPPFGEVDGRVMRVAAGLGLRTVMFDVASGDPGRTVTKDALVRWVMKQTRPGPVVVMHVNHLRFHTAEALPEIIAGLRARGFRFVTVGQLAAPPAAALPAAVADNRANFPAPGQSATSHGRNPGETAAIGADPGGMTAAPHLPRGAGHDRLAQPR
jgi:peptidoglycan-N-acetylglucosamine deacetylase